MTDISYHLRKINCASNIEREQSLSAILSFLENTDIYIDTVEMKRIVSFTKTADTPEARKLHELMTSTVDKKLSELVKNLGIDEKELLEASCFYRQVSKVFEKEGKTPKTIIDLCAGNCLAGTLWLLKGAEKVYFIDKKDSNNSRKVRKQLDLNKLDSNGDNTRYNYDNVDIFDEKIRIYFENAQKENALVASIHACGNLSDRIIELSIQYHVPFAVVPCCQSRDINHILRTSKYTLEDAQVHSRYFDDISGYSDLMRINYAIEQGYKIILRALPREITDKNRIIIGISPN